MEFLRTLLNIPESNNKTPEKFKNNEILINESPLDIINTQIKNLENINLSPLPTTALDKNMLHDNLTNYLRKIIFSLNTIFQNKLKEDKLADKSEIHFWNTIIKHFSNFNSVKFINLIFNKESYKIQEKALAWLCIILLEKRFYDFLESFYKSGIDK